MFTRQLGDVDAAGKLLHTALHRLEHPSLRHRDTRYARGFILRQLGIVAQRKEQVEKALAYYEEALALLMQVEDLTWIMAVCQNMGGLLLHQVGDVQRAAEVCTLGLESVRAMGDKGGIAWMLIEENGILAHQGEFDAARLRIAEANALFTDNGNPYEITVAQTALAENAFLRGDFQSALRQITTLLGHPSRLSQQDQAGSARNLHALISLHAGQQEEAESIWQQLLRDESANLRQVARQGLAQVVLANGRPAAATDLLQEAPAYWRETGNNRFLHEVLAIALYLPEPFLAQLSLTFAEGWTAVVEHGRAYSVLLALPAAARRLAAGGDYTAALTAYHAAAQYPLAANSAWIDALCAETIREAHAKTTPAAAEEAIRRSRGWKFGLPPPPLV
jgi:tetratricopeptide (TPR) repeat protein